MPRDTTIKQEMTALGIEPQHFETFYGQLKEQQQLPPQDVVPTEQYTTIVDYLKQKEVLGEDGVIQEDGLKVFDSRKDLEETLARLESRRRERPIYRNTGGIAPCRSYSRSSGGIAPCRY